jgi:hypothetical protein
VSLDVDPRTAAESARRLVEAAARNAETVREHRVALQQQIAQIAADAAASGVQFCACFFEVFEDQLPVQASLTIAVHTLDQANDPGAMVRELAEDEAGRTVDLVELEVGRAVRRSGRRRQAFPGTDQPVEFLARQYYVPVPSTTDQIAVLSFASPTLALQDDLTSLFDSMAATFVFTWAGSVPTTTAE